MSDLLVTGTDTGVGKTVVAAALVLALRERRLKAVGFKPVETGVEPGQPSDSELLAKASGQDEALARPLLRLAEPLTPALAAERAREALDPSQIEARLAALRGAGYTVVVEGAGGLLAPITWSYDARDLAERGRLEVVIVARLGLGTLNHALLTVEALRTRRVPIRGVVLNGVSAGASLAEQTNPSTLERLLPELRVITLPYQPGGDALEAAYAAVPLIAALR